MPLSEFEAFRRELIDAGANEVEDIYNSAYRRLRGSSRESRWHGAGVAHRATPA